ncbi:MAG: primosomal protein N' [Flavobacteriales bacterium Tduv]
MDIFHYVDVILPTPLEGTFTYHLSEELFDTVEPGMRVAIPFGSNKIYTGIVYSKHHDRPELYKTKEVYQILDKVPIVTKLQLKFWKWIAYYYMSSIGQVYKIALPSAFKIESETRIKAHKNLTINTDKLSNENLLFWETLQRKSSLNVQEASLIIASKNTLSTIKKFLDNGWIQLEEQLVEKYRTKKESYVFLHPRLEDDAAEQAHIFHSLERSPQQRKLLLAFFYLKARLQKPVLLKNLLDQYSSPRSALKALTQKKILEVRSLNVDFCLHSGYAPDQTPQTLTNSQEIAYREISSQFETKDTVVLHGITSIGKTEIYVRLIQEVLYQGLRVLYLLPEIALMTQIFSRLRRNFGDRIGLYHSKYDQNQRVELWKKTLQGAYPIILGARSALFLPLEKVGLIIIDEEHDTAFKQRDTAPHYHARDAALVWAKMQGAKCLLGSATPSLESYHNAQTEKYGWVTLNESYRDSKPPLIQTINLKEAHRKKQMQGLFSRDLISAMQQTLEEKKQIILFQNRRGYAPVIQCQNCGHISQCRNCDVSLTYHQVRSAMVCHYCNYTHPKPKLCFSCHSSDLDMKGFGTEQVEEQVRLYFPEVKVARMDADAMRRKFAYEKLIKAFEAQEIDVLVGTQMVTKDLYFKAVYLFGVIQADQLLSQPDFRAHERAFQILIQVAGRTNRKKEQGKVLIQSFQSEHSILEKVARYDYDAMCQSILSERKKFLYPPYCKMILLIFKHQNFEKLSIAVQHLTEQLRPRFREGLLGPRIPSIGKIRNEHLKEILIKIHPELHSLSQSRAFIQNVLLNFYTVKAYRSIKLTIDVDPA